MPLPAVSPVELASAATDLVLALVSFWAGFAVARAGAPNRSGRHWVRAFFFGGLAALFGTAAHALGQAESPEGALALGITQGLGLSAAWVLLAVWEGASSAKSARRAVPALMVLGVAAGLSPLYMGGRLVGLVGWSALAYAAALALHAGRAAIGRKGAMVVSLGMAILLLGLAAQRRIGLDLEWLPLDNNGIAHLFLAAGIAVAAGGLTISLRAVGPSGSQDRP